MKNKLWYIDQDVTSTVYRSKINSSSDTFVHSVSGSTLHHLWYHYLCHVGKFVTDNITKVADGVPSLKKRNLFFVCGDCSNGKMTNKIKGYNRDPERAIIQGGRYHVDYGFVLGNDTIKSKIGPLITIKDGFNCYLLIVDKFS